MKKIFLILFALYIYMNVYSQSTDLYDVNFDAPTNIPPYDESTQVFQDIYLQYEKAIRRCEEIIRSEEKNIRQEDLTQTQNKYEQKLAQELEKYLEEQKKHQEELSQAKINFEQELSQEREKAQKELNQALARQKQEIYENEIEQLRNDEYEKLSAELNNSISKELTEKFTVEYDSEYEKKLRDITEKLVAEYEQKLAQELEKSLEEQKKHQEELSQAKINFEQELSQEREKAQKELNQALARQKQEIYENEIEQLRNDEYEKLSAELNNSISKELTEKFTVEYDSEYEKKLRDITEKLVAEYEAKITEIEQQKESEMKAWIKENKKQVLEETNARTERLRIIIPYIAAVITVAVIILLCWLLVKVIIKNKHEIIAKQKEEADKNQKIDTYKAEYSNRLKRVGSSNVYRDEIKQIYKEINESQENSDMKMLQRKALVMAEKEFDLLRITLSIDEYRRKFDDLNPKRFFNTWNSLGDDTEAKKGIISDFEANIAEYEKYAISACKSKNDTTEIANMLKPYVPVLRSNSKQLNVMKDSEIDESLKEHLFGLSTKYQDLAEKFNKGKF